MPFTLAFCGELLGKKASRLGIGKSCLLPQRLLKKPVIMYAYQTY